MLTFLAFLCVKIIKNLIAFGLGLSVGQNNILTGQLALKETIMAIFHYFLIK